MSFLITLSMALMTDIVLTCNSCTYCFPPSDSKDVCVVEVKIDEKDENSETRSAKYERTVDMTEFFDDEYAHRMFLEAIENAKPCNTLPDKSYLQLWDIPL
jgi:hypothetical protein